MDANEYKTYLLGLIFYKYLSDSYLAKVYDLLNDENPDKFGFSENEYEDYAAMYKNVMEDKELYQVLPGHNRNQLQVLMCELRKEGRIYCEGSTHAARWFAVDF